MFTIFGTISEEMWGKLYFYKKATDTIQNSKLFTGWGYKRFYKKLIY